MTQIMYGCGHSPDVVFLDNNVMSLTAYALWENSTGPEGDKSECWTCYCNHRHELSRTKPEEDVSGQ